MQESGLDRFYVQFEHFCSLRKQDEQQYLRLMKAPCSEEKERAFFLERHSEQQDIIQRYRGMTTLDTKIILQLVYIKMLKLYQASRYALITAQLDTALIDREKYFVIENASAYIYAQKYLVVRFLEETIKLVQERILLTIRQAFKPNLLVLNPSSSGTQAAVFLIHEIKNCKTNREAAKKVHLFNRQNYVKLLGTQPDYSLIDQKKQRHQNCRILYRRLMELNRSVRLTILSKNNEPADPEDLDFKPYCSTERRQSQPAEARRRKSLCGQGSPQLKVRSLRKERSGSRRNYSSTDRNLNRFRKTIFAGDE